MTRKVHIHVLVALLTLLICAVAAAGDIDARVIVITEKLPIEKQDKMRGFDNLVKEYIENTEWLEDGDSDVEPIAMTLQMFLTDIPSSVEDRYKCEFLISSTDVQYFDKRFRFPYNRGEVLVYSDQAVDPLTGVINFYVNMVLGSELDKYGAFRGDVYYKRAQNIAALGKFIRSEFVYGWVERDELISRVFEEPFMTFRKMKDYYFYALYVLEQPENRDGPPPIVEARHNMRIALDMLAEVMEKGPKLDEPKQFLNAHYVEYIELFKDAEKKSEIFKKLKALDPEHDELYEEHIGDS